ncbi:HNH endonuclease [Geobacillus vulcani]|uniref:HNH endonuclease n=1 Tax=Geobacillus vulcani TaxID=135517 RepID=UPI00053B6F84|nr:HNH endonuclease [Geobacillus vulcani]
MIKTLTCKVCGMEKEISEFRGDKRTKLGVIQPCKACRKAQDAQSSEAVRKRYREAKRRAKKLGVIDTLDFNEYVDVSSGDTCTYCGTELNDSNRSVDHVYPMSKRFANGHLNIVPCCRKCNKRKGTMHVYDFYKSSELFTDELFREFVRSFTERLVNRPISEREVDAMIEGFRAEAELLRSSAV